MIQMVTKRDGRIVPYDENKIRTAISLAMKNADLTTEDIPKTVDTIMVSVNNYLNELDDYTDAVDIETIQDIIIKSMKDNDYSKIAKSYTTYRNKRTKIRERKSSLMQQIKEMAESDAEHSDSKRENANINGDTAMGTMLKYGTTTSKEYYLREVIPEDASTMHREGSIHIHDMDFYSLTTTCAVRDTKILLKVNNDIISTTFAYFDDYFTNNQDKVALDDIKVFDNGQFVDVKWCSRRNVKDSERVYRISTKYDSLELTEDHQVPIVRDGKSILSYVKDIRIGDSLKVSKSYEDIILDIGCDTDTIISIEQTDYKDYVYDIETESHYFTANSFVIHNCTQLPIGKLLTDGFATGHGFLRSPSNIISAAALTCIAIQSNQNDQHK